MPENPAHAVNMSWFYSLDPTEQASLLRNPDQSIPWEFVQRIEAWVDHHGISQEQVIRTTRWSGNPTWKLNESVIAQLEADRAQLDTWWDTLNASERNNYIEHRDKPIRDEHQDERVQIAASVDVDPRMIRPYIETKARSEQSDPS